MCSTSVVMLSLLCLSLIIMIHALLESKKQTIVICSVTWCNIRSFKYFLGQDEAKCFGFQAFSVAKLVHLLTACSKIGWCKM